MQTVELVSFLDKYIIDYNFQVPDISIENGIHFFYPAPNDSNTNYLFVGSTNDWQYVLEKHMIIPKSTYIVCSESEKMAYINMNIESINVIIVNCSVSRLLTELQKFTTGNSINEKFDPSLYLDFWNNIMNATLVNRNQILSYVKDFPFSLKTHISVIVVKKDYTNTEITNDTSIENALNTFFVNTNIFFYNDYWVVLYSQEKDTSDELDFSYEEFSSLLQQFHLICGISYACQLPELYRTLFLTAQSAIEIGSKLQLHTTNKNIFTFHQVSPYYLIWLGEKSFTKLHNTTNILYLAHPDLARLYFYDIKKNTNLIDVLFTYLSCGQNINLSAQELFMHKNTVLNKLKKIEQIINHEINYEEDHFILLLSCMILKYQRNYSNDNLEDYFL